MRIALSIVVSLIGLGIMTASLCCSPSWSSSDAKAATNAANAQKMIEAICANDATCKPSQVRALERMAYCSNASMLVRHGLPTPDAGIQCQP